MDDYEYEEEDFEADDDIPREEDEDFESDDDYNPVKVRWDQERVGWFLFSGKWKAEKKICKSCKEIETVKNVKIF